MTWIDIVYIGIIVVFAIIGLAKGLFDSILSLVASVASVFLAFWASKPVAAFLNKIADVNGFFEEFLVNNMGVAETGANGQTLSELASVCTLALSVLIVFVLIKIAVWLLAKLFDSVSAQSTAASGMDRLLGVVFGAAKGFAIVLVALGVTSIFSMVPAFEAKIDSFLNDSSITRGTYIYVDEWVENELEDRLDDFVKDLADYADVPEAPADNQAEIAYNALKDNNGVVSNTAWDATEREVEITLLTEHHLGENLNVSLEYGSTFQVFAGADTTATAFDVAVSNGNKLVISEATGATFDETVTYTVTVNVTFTLVGGTDTHTAAVSFTFVPTTPAA